MHFLLNKRLERDYKFGFFTTLRTFEYLVLISSRYLHVSQIEVLVRQTDGQQSDLIKVLFFSF